MNHSSRVRAGGPVARFIAAVVLYSACNLLPGPAQAQTPTPIVCSPDWTQLLPCSTPSTTTDSYIACYQLKDHTFVSGEHVHITDVGPCLSTAKSIGSGLSNIIIESANVDSHGNVIPVTIQPYSNIDNHEDLFDIYGQNIAIKGLRIMYKDGPVRFQQGIYVQSSAQNVTIENVTVASAVDAGIVIAGNTACLRGTTVTNAGPQPDGHLSPGYDVLSTAQGNIDFRGAVAMNNSSDGFSVDHDAQVAKIQFLNCQSTMNTGDGFDVAGPTVEVLCSQSYNNGPTPVQTKTPGTATPTPTGTLEHQGRGIVMWGKSGGTPSSLRVENSDVHDNAHDGINVGANNTTAQIIGDTIVFNSKSHGNRQIAGGTALYVYDTIGVGAQNTQGSGTAPVFIFSSGSRHCGYNIYTGTVNGSSGDSCLSQSNGSRRGIPSFIPDGTDTVLQPNTLGWDEGVDPRTKVTPVFVAGTQDANGAPRPRAGGGYDIGAYEATATATVTNTASATATRTNTRTATPSPVITSTYTRTPTITNTPTITSTPLPTATGPMCTPNPPCVGDCDCNGMVTINELVIAVNIALGYAPTDQCFAALNAAGIVDISQIIKSVNDSLGGCPVPAETPSQGVNMAMAMPESIGSAILQVGSVAGTPGSTVQFVISTLGGAHQLAGLNADLLIPIYSGYQIPVFSNPDCVIAPGLAAQGLELMTQLLFHGERFIVSQASQSSSDMQGKNMECPGPTMPDGVVAICTATIGSGVPAGAYSLYVQNVSDGYLFNGVSVSDAYGDLFNTVVAPGVLVVNGATAANAGFTGQMVPSTMTGGQDYTVTVTMQNTGGTVWTSSPLAQYSLGAVNPQDNTTWGMSRIDIDSGETVAQGSSKTFTFTVTAPNPPSNNYTYDFQWRMVIDNSDGTESWFGDTTTDVPVTVACGACGCS